MITCKGKLGFFFIEPQLVSGVQFMEGVRFVAVAVDANERGPVLTTRELNALLDKRSREHRQWRNGSPR